MTDDFFIDLNITIFWYLIRTTMWSLFPTLFIHNFQEHSLTASIDQLNKVIIFQFNFLWDFLL